MEQQNRRSFFAALGATGVAAAAVAKGQEKPEHVLVEGESASAPLRCMSESAPATLMTVREKYVIYLPEYWGCDKIHLMMDWIRVQTDPMGIDVVFLPESCQMVPLGVAGIEAHDFTEFVGGDSEVAEKIAEKASPKGFTGPREPWKTHREYFLVENGSGYPTKFAPPEGNR